MLDDKNIDMKYLAIIFILVLASVAFALPQPAGYVNDYANILPNRQALESALITYERNTTIEIAIVTIDVLPPGQTAATYAVELFNQWGIGKKGEDNGILVLIIQNGTTGNRLRIELGYSIQGYITGAEAGRILDAALPYYNQADYGKTAEVILDGLFNQLKDYQPGKIAARTDFNEGVDLIISFLPVIIIFLFIIFSIAFSEKCPQCGSRKLSCNQEYCVCMKCGRKFKRKKKSGFVPIFIGGFGGFSGGGFGGGGSGGGGAGR